MKLERTHDMALVESIMRHPSIWPHVHDDGAEDWQPFDHDAIYWMLVTRSNGESGGVFMVHQANSYCYEMHTCLLPCAWGTEASKAAQILLGWAFKETECRKMVTNVPAYNRAAFRFAKAGGMQQEGINRASFMRNGQMIDQIMLGITKEEWLCQQQSQSPQP